MAASPLERSFATTLCIRITVVALAVFLAITGIADAQDTTYRSAAGQEQDAISESLTRNCADCFMLWRAFARGV
jgi:hypothetical protein